jgi:hypothetical protein
MVSELLRAGLAFDRTEMQISALADYRSSNMELTRQRSRELPPWRTSAL